MQEPLGIPGPLEFCPGNQPAVSLAIKYHNGASSGPGGGGPNGAQQVDAMGLTGVRLYCEDGSTVESAKSDLGVWAQLSLPCEGGIIGLRFQIVEYMVTTGTKWYPRGLCSISVFQANNTDNTGLNSLHLGCRRPESVAWYGWLNLDRRLRERLRLPLHSFTYS